MTFKREYFQEKANTILETLETQKKNRFGGKVLKRGRTKKLKKKQKQTKNFKKKIHTRNNKKLKKKISSKCNSSI
jgi:hypothetical protein